MQFLAVCKTDNCIISDVAKRILKEAIVDHNLNGKIKTLLSEVFPYGDDVKDEVSIMFDLGLNFVSTKEGNLVGFDATKAKPILTNFLKLPLVTKMNLYQC